MALSRANTFTRPMKTPALQTTRNEELYLSKEVKENALVSEGKSLIMPIRNNNLRKSICVSRPLSMTQAAKIT